MAFIIEHPEKHMTWITCLFTAFVLLLSISVLIESVHDIQKPGFKKFMYVINIAAIIIAVLGLVVAMPLLMSGSKGTVLSSNEVLQIVLVALFQLLGLFMIALPTVAIVLVEDSPDTTTRKTTGKTFGSLGLLMSLSAGTALYLNK